jgi:RNA polymerase sigma-70 factor (ECF subfamily)
VLRTFPLRAAPAEHGPDDALVVAAQAEPAEFAAIYERYLPRVYRYLAAKASNPEEAADLTQAVFLKAFDGIGKFRAGKSPFASWLFRIARNTAVDAHRRKRPSVPWDLAGFEPEAAGTPETDALRHERLRELRTAIATLDTSKRDLLALRYAGGLTAAEIAPLVGKSTEAVKKQLQRTLRELKEHYRDHE